MSSLRQNILRLSMALCWLGALSTAATAETPPAESDVDSLDENPISDELFESSVVENEPTENEGSQSDAGELLPYYSGKVISEKSVSPLQEGLDDVTEAAPISVVPKWQTSEDQTDETTPAETISVENTSEIVTDSVDSEASTAVELQTTADLPTLAQSDFVVFPVGLNVGDRNVLPTTLIKGSEASGAIAFDDWLVPFDSVTQALGISVTVLESGEWELRSPGIVTRIEPENLQTDSDLGLVLSIRQIETLLGVPAQFEQLDYAIRLDPPWLGLRRSRRGSSSLPVLTEGLPAISPRPLSISGVAQTVTISGQTDQETRTQGSFSGLGTAFGGSWYLRTDQPSVTEANSWRLGEFQYLKQGPSADVALGSQPTFWRGQGRSSRQSANQSTNQGNSLNSRQSNDYWGATYVQRWGFEPPETRGTGGFSPRQRVQASAVGRTVAGEALPGTLVQLTQGLSGAVIDEALVDSSGVYRFEDVVGSRGGGAYQVLLYPNGQLTRIPEIRTASFSSLPGQLPKGASALLVSGGFNRSFERRSDGRSNRRDDTSFLGDFDDFRGGISYQRGLSESLTMGVGFVQDQTPQALAEAFYVPGGLPLKVAVSALSDLRTGEVDVAADVQYRPSRKLYMSLNSDRLSQRFSAEWQAAKGLTLLAKGNTRDEAVAAGVRFSMSDRNRYFFGNATIDTKSRLRWNLSSRLGALGLRHFGNENTTQSELFYNLSGDYAYGDGHGVLLNYETQKLNQTASQLGTASWRYRSKQRASDGRQLWDMRIGYGVGSEGSGAVASVSTAILPGVEVQARYQGISAFGDRDTFQIEFRPRLNFQGGLSPANRYQDRLRTRGGLLLQPFFDDNGNGERDRGEAIYSENLDLMLSVNYEDLSQYRPDIRRQGAFLTLLPDLYRVDVDPAGYPLDWKAAETAYAVGAAAGQYTPVEIPLTRAYTLIGTVTDADEKALAGQRVEAILVLDERQQLSEAERETAQGTEQKTERRLFSITNGAGAFYLEGLSQGEYRFEIGGEPVDIAPLTLTAETEGLQEMNFQLMPDEIGVEAVPAVPEEPASDSITQLEPTLI